MSRSKSQLHKLVTFCVNELGQGAHVEREIMLVKVQASGYGRDEVKHNTEIFRGQIIDVTPSIYTVQRREPATSWMRFWLLCATWRELLKSPARAWLVYLAVTKSTR